MLPRSAIAKTRLGLRRLIVSVPTSQRQLSSIVLAKRSAIQGVNGLGSLTRLSQIAPRWYASAAVAEKPMEDEGEEFFASDIIPNAVVTETSTKSKSSTNGQIDDPRPSGPSDASKPVALSTPFTSLKGRVDHNILKALTVKPFQLEAMSEVQKRVLALMPELSGGKPKASAVEVGEGGEEVIQTNVVGQKVSTAARGKHDLLVKAKTGTGKTIAFLVPAVESRLNQLESIAKSASEGGSERRATAKGSVGAVIISPTRELATQIANEAIKVCTWHKDLNVRLFVGGMSRYSQLSDFKRGRKDILVATPGRMKDMLSEPVVRDALAETQTLILDEADTLLELGFAKDLNDIISALPKERQTFLFSATVSSQIRDVARKSLKADHQFIDCVPKNETNVHTHIPQYYTPLSSAADQIPETLKLIAQDQMENPDSKVILFLPTTKATMLWATILRELDDTLPSKTQVHEIHSQLDQRRRSRASDKFRQDKRPSVLVTSDVSARGVDYPGVTRVIQVGVPSSAEQYIHRVGRTGRGGKAGGRGDLVLLPFEHNFVNALLPKIPIKLNNPKTTTESLSGLFSPDQLSAIETKTKALLPSLDPEAIREVYTSMIGYYLGRSDTLHKSSQEIYKGLQDWSTEAAGMEKPPFLSDSFLSKLGLNSKPKFGQKGRGGGGGGGFGGPKRSSFGVSREGREGGRSGGGFGDFKPRDRGDRPDRGDRGDRGDRFADRRSGGAGGFERRPRDGDSAGGGGFGGERRERRFESGDRDRPSFKKSWSDRGGDRGDRGDRKDRY